MDDCEWFDFEMEMEMDAEWAEDGYEEYDPYSDPSSPLYWPF